jgi:hypothetical protein
MEPVEWDHIAGGREALDAAFAAVESKVTAIQTRFSNALDRVGPRGMATWDPIAGTIELRGRMLRAQQLGSFDGNSWLWSWANTFLNIPEDKTTFARAFRDAAEQLGVPALRTPMIKSNDEELGPRIGGLAIAHGFGEAFYYANESQVYLLERGQLEDLEATPIKPRRYAVVFSHARRSLGDVLAHLRGDKYLAKLPWMQADDDHASITGPGYALTLTRHDRLRDVLAHVKALPHGQDAARGAATVFVLEGTMDSTYNEAQFTNSYGAWAPAQHFSGSVLIPWQALSICERLNQLARLALYDAQLRSFYPRS